MPLQSLIPSRLRTLSSRIRDTDPFYDLRREMERLFEPDWFFKRENLLLSPSIEVKESDKELIITAELPGVDEKDIDVSLSNNTLTIKGEKKAEREEKGDNYYVSERSYGNFSRSFTLPYEVDQDAIEARFSKGVLTLTFPKSEFMQQKIKKIEVKV